MSLAAWSAMHALAPPPPNTNTDHAQYSNTPISRTSRRRMVPFLASPATAPSAPAIHQAAQNEANQGTGHIAIELDGLFAGPVPQGGVPGSGQGEGKKEKTLFGPPVGDVGREERAKWGPPEEGNGKEELPAEVLKKWVERSNEASAPTTTLQALTNLKRPSIKLSPLHLHPTSTEPDPLASHVLEFAYDGDAPRISISVRVLPAGTEVFNTVVPGGFGKELKADQGAIIELGRYEIQPPSPPTAADTSTLDTTSTPGPTPSTPTTSTPFNNTNNEPATPAMPSHPPTSRRRFSFLPGRRGSTPASAFISPSNAARTHGPALPLVDALATPPPPPTISPAIAAAMGLQVIDRREQERTFQRERERAEEEASGVRIGIWVEALDAGGKRLPNRNVQATFLHVHRVGQKPATTSTATTASPVVEEGEGSALETTNTNERAAVDNRPWIVRVVHREAIIGKHTFTLHEIYGLASASSASAPPPPPPSHSYPPEPVPMSAEPTAPECILCLSSPRSVVLMPCRHLVACRECALNMLEFGAGGSVVQPMDEAAAAAGGGAGAGAGGAEGGAEVGGSNGAAVQPPREGRRKKKVKGWFCPICRQPYTSMLRISSATPEGELVAEIDNASDPLGTTKYEHHDDEDVAGNRASTSSAPAGWKEHAALADFTPTISPAPTAGPTSASSGLAEPLRGEALGGVGAERRKSCTCEHPVLPTGAPLPPGWVRAEDGTAHRLAPAEEVTSEPIEGATTDTTASQQGSSHPASAEELSSSSPAVSE